MSRTTFLTLAALIATGVGLLALVAPATLLVSKGVTPNAAAQVWVREVGALLLAVALSAFLVRRHPHSLTMRAFLLGNAVLQFALFPIEIAAYLNGVITSLMGIVPNSVLHVLLGFGFAYFATRGEQGLPADHRG